MNTVETQAIVNNWRELVRSVDVRNVIDELFQEQIVSTEEIEYINKGQTTYEQSRRLLIKVIDCSDPATFSIFLHALQEHYPFLVEKIHYRLSSLKRMRFKNSKQKHAVEVEYDVNVTEFERKVHPVEYGCSICSVDDGCMCNVHSASTNCESENSTDPSKPPIEHADTWSPSSSVDTEQQVESSVVRNQRRGSSYPPNTQVDSANAVRDIFGSFDINRYQRLSLIPAEFLQQLDTASDTIALLRQLSEGGAPSTPERAPQEYGTPPDVILSTQTNHDALDGTYSNHLLNGTGTQPENVPNTCSETRVKQVVPNGNHVNGVPAPGVIRRRPEPTESAEEERDDTDLKQVVPNGVSGRGMSQGGATGGEGHNGQSAKVNKSSAKSPNSRLSTRFMNSLKSLYKRTAQPSESNGVNGICHTCRRSVLITPRVVHNNRDFGFRLGSTTSTQGVSVEHITNGGPAAGQLHHSDIIFSINGENVKGWNKRKSNSKIEATNRQLTLEVESLGEVLEHRIGLTLSRPSPEESWGFSLIHGINRPRYPRDTEFYCTAIDPDSPVGRSGLLQVGDVLTGCIRFSEHSEEDISFAEKSEEEVNNIIRSMAVLSLHIKRKEFIRERDPRYGHSAC